MISAANVTFAYDGSPVLAGVGLKAYSGGVVGLIGPNGSGKTTLLRILYAALSPLGGTVLVDDQPVATLTGRHLPQRIAVVAQESPPELPITVAEMVLLGRSPHRSSLQAYRAEDHRIAAAALRRVGLRELAERPYHALSGGEKQRTLIARAIAQQAGHLLLDEPTNHLDVRYQHEVLQLVRALDITTVVVLHDLNLAARYCDHLVLLDRGTVVKAGRVAEVLTPRVLEPVYRISVRTIEDTDCLQLLFRPALAGKATPGSYPS